MKKNSIDQQLIHDESQGKYFIINHKKSTHNVEVNGGGTERGKYRTYVTGTTGFNQRLIQAELKEDETISAH